MKILASSVCFAMLAAVACSSGDAPSVDAGAPDTHVAPQPDATTGATDTGMHPAVDTGTAGDDAGSDDTSSDDAGDDTDASTPDSGTPATDGAAGGLVINEILGKDVEFVELYNTGSAAIDLSGWGVTDAKDSDAGPGGMRTPVTFPSETMLGAGAYALVYGAPKDGGDPIPSCMASACVTATWNISNSSGATIYLEDPTSNVVEQDTYPAGTVGSGQSWARLPNGTGAFALATATPGAANTGP